MVEFEVSRLGVEVTNPVWRASRRKYGAMELPPLHSQGAGRFDDPRLRMSTEHAEYGVLYLGSNPKSSFIETLSGLRNHLSVEANVLMQSIMEVDEKHSFVEESRAVRSTITQHWMDDWQLTSASILTDAPVFDLANPASVQFVREELAVAILAMGLTDLDFSHVLGDNRDLTRAISRWIWTMTSDSGQPLFSGIRYRSRFDPNCICLALYEGRFFIDGDIDTQPISSKTPGLAEAASILRLKIA